MDRTILYVILHILHLWINIILYGVLSIYNHIGGKIFPILPCLEVIPNLMFFPNGPPLGLCVAKRNVPMAQSQLIKKNLIRASKIIPGIPKKPATIIVTKLIGRKKPKGPPKVFINQRIIKPRPAWTSILTAQRTGVNIIFTAGYKRSSATAPIRAICQISAGIPPPPHSPYSGQPKPGILWSPNPP